MSSDEFERPHPLQTILPFDDGRGNASAISVVPASVQAVGRFLDGDDSDSDLDGLSNEDLRREVDDLRACPDRKTDDIMRLFKAIQVLEHRGLLATPRWARCELVDVPATKPWRSRASARRRLLALLRRVGSASSPAHAEALAEFFAEDLVDSRSIGRFRTLARGIREGLVDPQTVCAAYRAAKKAGVRAPGCLLWSYVAERSPGLARMHVAGRRDSPQWFQ